jgi:hypothetical protein
MEFASEGHLGMENLRLVTGGASVHDRKDQYRKIMGGCIKEDTFDDSFAFRAARVLS